MICCVNLDVSRSLIWASISLVNLFCFKDFGLDLEVEKEKKWNKEGKWARFRPYTFIHLMKIRLGPYLLGVKRGP